MPTASHTHKVHSMWFELDLRQLRRDAQDHTRGNRPRAPSARAPLWRLVIHTSPAGVESTAAQRNWCRGRPVGQRRRATPSAPRPSASRASRRARRQCGRCRRSPSARSAEPVEPRADRPQPIDAAGGTHQTVRPSPDRNSSRSSRNAKATTALSPSPTSGTRALLLVVLVLLLHLIVLVLVSWSSSSSCHHGWHSHSCSESSRARGVGAPLPRAHRPPPRTALLLRDWPDLWAWCRLAGGSRRHVPGARALARRRSRAGSGAGRGDHSRATGHGLQRRGTALVPGVAASDGAA